MHLSYSKQCAGTKFPQNIIPAKFNFLDTLVLKGQIDKISANIFYGLLKRTSIKVGWVTN